VTCKDWSHIWLNEGFANFFEALYWEDKTKNFDQYQSYVLNSAEDYFDEACNSYRRPIVYDFYLDPIDLFDRHAYAKGGCVLHMIRNYVGDENFKKSLKDYLDKYRYKSVETDDLRRALEDITKKNLDEFFKQWVYAAGHPELSVTHNADQSAVKIRIIQKQQAKRQFDVDVFKFPLDIKLVYSFANNHNKSAETHEIEISKKETEEIFQLPIDKRGQQGTLEWFSIDPNFKVLKEIVYVDSSKEMLIKQLLEGETVYEKVQAIKALDNNSEFLNDNDIITSLQNAVLRDNSYRVSVEAAKLLGKYTQSDYAYESIKRCIYSTTDRKIKNQLITSIGKFENKNEELLELFNKILNDPSGSYLVQSSAATAIGAIIHKRANIEPYISILKDAVRTNNSIFKEHIAKGSIDGLRKLSDNEDKNVVSDIIDFLITSSDYNSGNTNMIRSASTSALGDFVLQNKDKDKREVNERVLSHLEHSLHDKWWGTRRSAIAGMVAAFTGKNIVRLNDDDIERALEMLEGVSRMDVHAEVREDAKSVIKQIKESRKDPAKVEKTKLYSIKKMTRRRFFYKEWYR
jgi:aminopeptidase N